MIQKKVADIRLSDIQTLIDSSVPESRTIEYKRELRIGTDAEKKEFLADVSSFANTTGGDLIFGIGAVNGIATTFAPLSIVDIDAQKLQLENVIRAGIDPRISFTIHSIDTETRDHCILLIRVNESWNKPHRVSFSGSNRFYARNSAGKYELDVTQLRQAFTLSDGIEKRMQDFRAERIFALETEETFIPLSSKHIIVLHALPLEGFSSRINLERDTLLSLETENNLFRPMYADHWSAARINLEGAFSSTRQTQNGNVTAYVQLFRNGSVELVESFMLQRLEPLLIPHVRYEKEVIDGFKKAIGILRRVEINTPVLLSLSLLNVKGYTMTPDQRSNFIRTGIAQPIQKRNLILPGVMLNEYDENIERLLQPIFDLVWNACGLPKSENYNSAGEFLVRD